MDSSNKTKMYFVLVVLLSICLTMVNSFSAEEIKPRKEYIKFSHQNHIDNIGADCTSCHTGIEESSEASDNNLAHKEDCFTCHDGDAAPDDCELCHYDADNAVNFPNPVREVMFSHKNHFERIGEVDAACEQCHPGLGSVDYSTPENMPDMNTCVECHNNSDAGRYCESCHTKLETLRPKSHFVNWFQRHDDAVRSTSEDCALCHSFNYCQECHDGAALSGVTGQVGDSYSSYAPQSWGVNNMVLTRNHDLNYRYTHALEAKSKLENCQLCHDNETFCVDCHDTFMGDGTGKPSWHGGANWGALALARGSGGGRHAQMAKRDISVCASCHDANGDDPVCLACHMDRAPGKNNDLRTHTKNLYRGVQGPWHNDKSYVCFTCHINAEPQNPVGFCSYCHGVR
ncbi:cytochrome c3 family protein [candidate division KSB1 bacterium]